MRVAVISDTHLPRFGCSLPEPLVRGLESAAVERILHLGDWTTSLAVEVIESVAGSLRAGLDGVAGNNDPSELAERFGRIKIIEIGRVRLGLTHGDLGPGRTTLQRAVSTFATEPDLGAILFGHSHAPLLDWRPRVADPRRRQLLLNPGSATDRRRQPRCSWALLEIDGGEIGAELRFFDR